MKNGLSDFNIFNEVYSLNREELLFQMLEHRGPAFVLNCILHEVDTEVVRNILLTENYHNNYPTKKRYVTYKDRDGNVLVRQSNNKKHHGEKRTGGSANGTGHGSLKQLGSNWTQIGAKIATFTGQDRRDYVGMINFLHSSCDIALPILNTAKEVRQMQMPKKNRINSSKESPFDINDLLYEKNINDYDDLDEEDQSVFTNSKNVFDDYLKTTAYILSRLKDDLGDEDFDDDEDFNKIINRETDEEEDVLNDDDLSELTDRYGNKILTESRPSFEDDAANGYINKRGLNDQYTRKDLSVIRKVRGNGVGGLKKFVGKKAGDSLSSTDMDILVGKVFKYYGKKRNGKPTKGAMEAARIVNIAAYMSSSCAIFRQIANGYISNAKNTTIKNDV